MLNAKKISKLSSGARSFFLSGSRSNAADGSSCVFSEDETCVSQRQQFRNESFCTKQTPPLASNISAKVETLAPRDVAKAVVHSSISSGKPDSVNQSSSPDSSVITADQFVKVSIAAVNFLSDLVNYKFPFSNGGGVLVSAKNCMNDPLSNIKSSHVKHVKRENFSSVHPNSSSGTAVSSKSRGNNCNGSKGNGDQSGSVRDLKQVRHTGTDSTFTDSRDRKNYSQKSKVHSDRSALNCDTNLQSADVEYVSKRFYGVNAASAGVPKTKHFGNASHVLKNVSHILRGHPWGPSVEEALAKLNCSIDAFQANQILKQVPDHSVAFGFFYWLKQQSGFKHDGHTYTTMVGILGRARQFGAIDRLLDQMVNDGCRPNVVTYNRLIHSYGRANYLKEAIYVFNQMGEAGCEPDRVTFCTLIDIHAKAGFLDVAMCMYRRMQEAGLTPDTFTYSVIINCLGKAGHLNAAHRIFCEMVDQGCVPNLVTYNIMIALQAKARNYQIALKLYRDMQNAGFQPDRVTYSIIMEVLGHCGNLKEAESLFVEMRLKNWVPDEPVYGLLVDLWGKSGNVEKAWEWYNAMLDAGLRPNVPTCNSMLSAFLRGHRLSDAYSLLQTMVSFGLNPSLQTYTLLLSCCTDARSAFDMGFCHELMAITGHPAHAFLVSLPSPGPTSQNVLDHTSKFLDMMHSEDRESKRGIVDAVVDFLCKSGLKEEAGSVWDSAVLKNIYPDAVTEKSSCYWLINLHVMSDGTAVTALSRTLAQFRRKMMRSGVRPVRIDIVTGWGRRSRVTGTSLVRQAVQELLSIFSFPFHSGNENSGCFVGCGEALNTWLLHSCVERMHLL